VVTAQTVALNSKQFEALMAAIEKPASTEAPSKSKGDQMREALLAEYVQVCTSFRTLADIRFRLLAFLPLGAGVAAFASQTSTFGTMSALVISLFGLVATIGLATYNQRNDQFYFALERRAADIERELGLTSGSFAQRPGAWLYLDFRVFRHTINHSRGVSLIYWATIGLWLYGVIAASLEFLRHILADPARTLTPSWQTGNLRPLALILAIAMLALTARLVDALIERRKKQVEKEAKSAA